MKKSVLVPVAKELNELMGLNPKINTKGTAVEIKNQILEAATFLEENDDVTESTQKAIDELNAEVKEATESSSKKKTPSAKKTEKKPAKKPAKKKEPYPDSYEEEEDGEEVVLDDDDDNDDKESIATMTQEEMEEVTKKSNTKKPSKKKTPSAKKTEKKPAKRTKKAVIQKLLEDGATIDQMAQAIVDEGLDPDFEKNKRVTKLWLSKMGFNVKKAALKNNPVFRNE